MDRIDDLASKLLLLSDRNTAETLDELMQLVRTGTAMLALPEGTGVVKNMNGFCDIKRRGSSENDEWHTCGKIFLNPLEAAQSLNEPLPAEGIEQFKAERDRYRLALEEVSKLLEKRNWAPALELTLEALGKEA